MDRDALVAFAKRRLRIGSAGEGLLDDTRLVFNVNEALRHFSREDQWPWLRTSGNLSIGTTALGTYPTGYTAAQQLLYQTNPVTYVGLDELLAGQGRYVWTDNGVAIQVEPAPASTLTFVLWYFRFEPDLAAGASLPLAPTVHHDAIGTWAAHLGALDRNNFDLADSLAREYGVMVGQSRKLAFARKKGQVIRVTRRGDIGTTSAVW